MNSADALYQLLQKTASGTRQYTPDDCVKLWPTIRHIQSLKKANNAVILAHSYVQSDIVSTVADHVGDSLELSRMAQATDADTIVFSAVRFMAETAKLLNPSKTVLIPSPINGCSLADSITANDVIQLRRDHPTSTFVCYINTSAAVKAQCDICVTSSNVYDIVEALPTDDIYFLPDQLMGKNIQTVMAERGVKKTIRTSPGTCYVHEEYTPDMIDYVRDKHPDVMILAHPECHPEITQKCDFVGSTSQMLATVSATQAPQYFLLTECGLSNRLRIEHPDKQFIGTCTLCRYMKSNTLDQIITALTDPKPYQQVTIDPATQKQATACIQRMLDF
ncbi:quinolinate synthase [bacterium]|nr:quinolinate synthase [bacterium]